MVDIKQSALNYKNNFETNFENYLKRNEGCDLVLNDYIKFEKKLWLEIKHIIDTDEIDLIGLPDGYQPNRYLVLNEIWEAYGKEGNHLVMNKVNAILSFLNSKIKKDVLNIVSISNINNNFDKVPIEKLYKNYYTLVQKKYITEDELLIFMNFAFDEKKPLENKISFTNVKNKLNVIKYFYKHYKDLAGKIRGRQPEYARLLSDYFEGFEIEYVTSNFSKIV
jgi:hypothetical protein